ncbi:hypothetical protein [Streptomyces sp. ICC4]|uniref:hypothetical protein n=1 Tax=Streptomyces sp. ICC4 TaxID=2099584 RepID=UPI00195516B8
MLQHGVHEVGAQHHQDTEPVSRRAPQHALPGGVRHHSAHHAEPQSLRPALDGAEALFLLVAGEDPRAVLELAAAGGVRRVVLPPPIPARPAIPDRGSEVIA